MIPDLYAAAMGDPTESLKAYNIQQIKSERTRNGNIVLHVAAQFGQLDCVTEILEQCPALLRERNLLRETPLHMAARQGKLEIVKALTSHAKKPLDLLRATNSDKDTALHKAVQYDHFDIVRFLTREDREYSYPANRAQETPLYLAVESNNHPMVVAILENCALRDYSGPDGRTALHEAVLINKDPAIAKELVEWKPKLIGKLDARGWTAFHYAAWCGNVEGVEVMLAAEIPYQPSSLLAIAIALFTYLPIFTPSILQSERRRKNKQDTRGRTPLHIAAAQGHVSVMEMILSAYPEWWEIVDRRGDNILHIAIQFEREGVIEFIYRMPWSMLLMNQKNVDGNTPLHFLAASKLTAKKSSLWDYGGYSRSFNNNCLRPVDVAMPQVEDKLECRYLTARNIPNITDEHYKLKKIEEERKGQEERQKAEDMVKQRVKMAESQMIVASLLATITFAAAFTVPGGYDGNPGSEQGMAILAREAAFKAFIIANTIAAICSIDSVYEFVSAMSTATDEDEQDEKCILGVFLLNYAIGATTIAFMTGTYSMLPHGRLAILGCFMGSLFISRCFSDRSGLYTSYLRSLTQWAKRKEYLKTHSREKVTF